MDNLINKKMPVSIEAEQALLGSLIINPESFDRVGGLISVEDFYLAEHRHIYAALLKMFAASKVIDTVTLVNTLVEEGDRDEAGGMQYIALIVNSVPAVSNIREYAKIVKDKSVLRHLISICDDVSTEAYDESAPVKEIVDSAEQKIFNLSHDRDSKDFRHIRDILQNVYQDIETLAQTGGAVKGQKTGFSDLDKKLIQLGPGDMVIVGARPGMGKTSFAMNIAVNAAKTSGKAVCIFNLEMSGEQLVTRILSSEALVDSERLRTGQLRPEDWENIAGVVASLSGSEIYIDDTSSITAAEMKAKLRRVKNLGMVVIDYIGLMQSTTNTDNRAQQVGEISRSLKVMAKELGIPIVCCAQLNRGTEARKGEDRKPSLSDLRDSGSIEQDADIVLFLYRDEYYNDIKGTTGEDAQGAADSANTAEVIIAKNRHGAVGNVKMGWIGRFTKFRSLEGNVSE